MPKVSIKSDELKPRNEGSRRVPAQESYLTTDGREKPDPRPLAPPVGYIKQPSMWEQVREMVRRELSDAAVEVGAESFEEADDFEVGDFDPRSPYEEVFDPTPIATLKARHKKALEELAQREQEGGGGGEGGEGGPSPPSPPQQEEGGNKEKSAAAKS